MRREEAIKNKCFEPICLLPCETNELWLPITTRSVLNVKPFYSISSFGRVYSFNHNHGLMNQVDTWNGYLRVYLQLNNSPYCGGRYFLIHRILMMEFCYYPGCEDIQVNHKDGNKFNNNISNLEWVTCSENIQHAYDTGLKHAPSCEDSHMATITNEQAAFVAKLIIEKRYTHNEISEITGVPVYIVHNIANGSSWKKIYDEYGLSKYKRESRPGFSDDELHKICEYFQNNSYRYSNMKELFCDTITKVLNRKYEPYMYTSLMRIYNHKTRRYIVDKYNF